LTNASDPGPMAPAPSPSGGRLDNALERTSAASLRGGNRLELLHNGPDTYDDWLSAIAGARRWVHLDNYIFSDDWFSPRCAWWCCRSCCSGCRPWGLGRRKAGGVGPALGAAVILTVVVSALIFLVGVLFYLPVIEGLVGTGILVVILVQSLPLLVGAIGGGSLSASLALYGRRADFDSPKG
jgi:hypothetical protein